VPGIINRVPVGLLSLLDMKTQGSNASELSGVLSTVLEAQDFYLSPLREYLTANSAAVGATGVLPTTLTVPNGTIWLLRAVCARFPIDVAVGATIEFTVGYSPVPAGGFFALGNRSALSGAGTRPSSAWEGTYLLQPGESISALISAFTGAPGAIRFDVNLVELTI
jgi:hypothetical protein